MFEAELYPPVKVILKVLGDSTINPFTKILIGECVAPTGTVAVKEVTVAAVTFAFTPPNQTILFTIVELKFVPVIVTSVPIAPLVGERFVIFGTCEYNNWYENNTKKQIVIFFCNSYHIFINKLNAIKLILINPILRINLKRKKCSNNYKIKIFHKNIYVFIII